MRWESPRHCRGTVTVRQLNMIRRTRTIAMKLHYEVFGSGAPTLLLLHGMGVNGAVWKRFIREIEPRWPGRIIAPDLRGHGRSPHGAHYDYGHHAVDCADLLEASGPVFIVGHSMGGAIAVQIANGDYGIDVQGVLAFAVKTDWTSAELEKAWGVAKAPVRWFDTRAEAVERFLRVAGLVGLVANNDPVVDAGVLAEGERFRLSMDPATFSAPGPDFGAMLRAARTPVRLASGSEDKMAPIAMASRHDPEAVLIAGAGHNVHVEAPAKIAALVQRLFGN
jgi:pimeloyl-ACP methyl ester carboxylesterase